MQIRVSGNRIDVIRRGRSWLLVSGALLLLTGATGILWPITVARVSEVFVGMLIAMLGISAVLRGLLYSGSNLAPGALLLGASALALSAFILLQPTAAATLLAALVAIVLLLDGLVTLQIALALRSEIQWRWLLAAALISIAAGAAVAVGLPDRSMATVGLLIGGVALIGGAACLAMASALRNTVIDPKL